MLAPRNLPSALGNEKLEYLLQTRKLVLFLDYDGTLTKIVEEPSKALLPLETKDVLSKLSKICPVAILSGRDVQDVRRLVGIDNIVYAGSHGFDIITASGMIPVSKRWISFPRIIDQAEKDLRLALDGIYGVRIERKHFGVAVHYRQVKKSNISLVKSRFSEVISSYPSLKKSDGKKVIEALPNARWNKGMALRFLLDTVFDGRKSLVLPIFIGDDRTDEDAFREIRNRGIGILVADKENKRGRRNTLARYYLRSPKEVRSFLQTCLRESKRRIKLQIID